MIPDRRQRLKQLFADAVVLPPGERARFVASVPEADAALRHELESLLSSYDRAGGFLERPPELSPLNAYGISIDAPLPTLPPGRKLGPYEIRERLGAGGMGQVYRALDVRLDRI